MRVVSLWAGRVYNINSDAQVPSAAVSPDACGKTLQARVLVFDEASSSVDADVGRRIHQSLSGINPYRTPKFYNTQRVGVKILLKQLSGERVRPGPHPHAPAG